MLKNAVSLVTGGASGLGRATVEHFFRAGSRVILADLPTSEGGKVATELGKGVTFVPMDVLSEEDVGKVLEVTKNQFGRLDITVNCAGIAFPEKVYDFKQDKPHTLDSFRQILNVNTVGTFNVIRLVAGLMAKNAPNADGQRGVIVNTASVLGYDAQSGLSAYAASKAAIIGMTLPIARELSGQGIRVVTVAPGFFQTQMTGYLPDKVCQFLISTIPFPKRAGRPAEFARFVEAIVENPLLNGEVIRLDGAARFNV
ncbi:3-hydroxyacyl-CoA dehydrogenase type-2-like [Topomyia yanbarensis]|uniref:3-hydroxyacyl-CoA dehydrogenase type-2-like n=1 Tax=Topomyia yanbarensis TaxID=2498891 RepID=UPI00273BE23E|nr:3-hydroxyacyl-CoA dehydrogenase type-2-like [Topomyia yanbarensis]